MAKITLAAPWTIYYRQIQALFKEDEGIKVLFNEDTGAINIYVEDTVKANALATLLPITKTFGNVTININVIPGNVTTTSSTNDQTVSARIKQVFEGNKAVSYIKNISGVFTNDLVYIVFVKEVVQFFNDNLNDIHGLCSTLYQNLAEEVFEDHPGVCFCTDVDNNMSIGCPLGEWP